MSGSATSNIIAQLIPTLLGSPTAVKTGGTTSSSSKSDSTSTNALMKILQDTLSSADDDGKTQAIIDSLFSQSAKAFLPIIGKQAAAGIYNSTTLAQLAQEARGSAFNQAAKTVLDYKTNKQVAATNAASALGQLNTTKTGVTSPTTQTTSPNTLTQLLSGSVLGYGLYKQFGTDLKDLFSFGSSPSDYAAAGKGLDVSREVDGVPTTANAFRDAKDTPDFTDSGGEALTINDPSAGSDITSIGYDAVNGLTSPTDTGWMDVLGDNAAITDTGWHWTDTGLEDGGLSDFFSTDAATNSGDLFSGASELLSSIWDWF